MFFFIGSAARWRGGQPPSPGLDVFLIVSAGIIVALTEPKAFATLADEIWKGSLPQALAIIALVCIFLFILLLGVEDRVLAYAMQRHFVLHKEKGPKVLADVRFPYSGFLLCWALEATAIAAPLSFFVSILRG